MKSKTERLLAHLKAGKPITGATAYSRFGIYRLSSVIHRARKFMHIGRKMFSKNGDQFAKYSTKFK